MGKIAYQWEKSMFGAKMNKQLEKALDWLDEKSNGLGHIDIWVNGPNNPPSLPIFKGILYRIRINRKMIWYCVDTVKTVDDKGFTRNYPIRIKRICV